MEQEINQHQRMTAREGQWNDLLEDMLDLMFIRKEGSGFGSVGGVRD